MTRATDNPNQHDPAGERRPVSRRSVLLGGAFTAAAAVIGMACADDGPQSEVGRAVTSLDPPPATGLPGSGQVVAIRSLDNAFRPDRVQVRAGTEVVWTNEGRNHHDIHAADGSWGVDKGSFGPGSSYSHVFTEPGEAPYYCTIHGTPHAGMTGTVVVTG
jgi:plastocyanin